MSEIKVVDDFDDATVKEPASSEAEQANRTVDNKDRLNINKEPPQSTAWEREAHVDKQQELDKPKKEEEPKYPFNDAEPIFAYYGNDKRTLLFFVLRHADGPQGQPGPTDTHQTVSYTHLTLPPICSV